MLMQTLANAILEENVYAVRECLRYSEEINQLDEYGFTPLIEAAIMDNIEIAQLLLAHGADPNLQDAVGNTPLHWAAENNNEKLCRFFIQAGANPNAYNYSGQPVLVMPALRKQTLRKYLIQAGADQAFAQDFINTKLIGHLFELIGTANIISPEQQFVEVDFEGFYIEVTLGLIADSLAEFQNHFAARQLRPYGGLARLIVDALHRASRLIKYQQYRVDIKKHSTEIEMLIQQEPLIIPIGYEGHAITFIRFGDYFVKCDRREDSRHYDNIVIYRMGNPEKLTLVFIKHLLYQKQSSQFIEKDIINLLNLSPVTELSIESQISGNCSWANVEAVIPTLFFLMLSDHDSRLSSIDHHKKMALHFFHRFRDWNKTRALNFCIQSYHQSDAMRKACKAEVLATILFERCDPRERASHDRIETILSVFIGSPFEYILKNYIRVYFYENYTEEGKRFAQLLKQHGMKI